MTEEKTASSMDAALKEISEKSGTSIEDIKKQIEEKQDELSGLVSEEGAMHIVARELGVNLLKEKKRDFKISNLVSGLRAVDIIGKIMNITDVREFERNGKKGQVLNITLGDETGTTRLSMWNDEIKILEKLGLKQDDCIKLSNGYVKIDNMDNPELRLGRGNIEKIDAKIDVPAAVQGTQGGYGTSAPGGAPAVANRQVISDLKEGGFAEVRGAMVQIFKRNPFYGLCPNCDARLTQKDDGLHCEEHGKVEPKQQLVISGVLDDGTDNIRVVFFREAAESIFGKGTEELVKIAKGGDDNLVIYDSFENLGKEFIIKGRVKMNSFTESIELVANDVAEVDVKKEAEVLIKEFKGSK
jgi:hypothetical protein